MLSSLEVLPEGQTRETFSVLQVTFVATGVRAVVFQWLLFSILRNEQLMEIEEKKSYFLLPT